MNDLLNSFGSKIKRKSLPGEKFNLLKVLAPLPANIPGQDEETQTIPPLATTYLLGMKHIVVNDPEVTAFLLRKEDKLVIENLPTTTQRLLGKNAISVVQYGHHAKQRKLFDKSFAPKNIEGMLPAIVDICRNELGRWEIEGCKNFFHGCRRLALDVTIATVFGDDKIPKHELAAIREQFVTFGQGLFAPPINLPFTKYGKALTSRKWLVKEFIGRIHKIRESGQSPNDFSFLPLFESMIFAENPVTGDQFSDEEIADNCMNIIFAGQDTTSCTMAYLLAILHSRSDIVELLRTEQEEVDAQYGAEYTVDKIKAMKLVDALCFETLRYFPIVSILFKDALMDFEIPGQDFTVKKGEKLLLGINATHYWKEPSNLFKTMEEKVGLIDIQKTAALLQGDGEKPNWMPFSEGKRKCLGKPLVEKELRIFVAELVRGYDFVLHNEKHNVLLDSTWVNFPFPSPNVDIQVTVSKR